MTLPVRTFKASEYTKPARPKHPPRGLICVDGSWQVRFAGFVTQRELTCWNGHPVHIRGGSVTEGVICCNHMDERAAPRCPARLLILKVRARLYFAMDITAEEDAAVELVEMDLDDIVEHFGLQFPSRVQRKTS